LPIEELDADLVLELADLLAERRLRGSQCRCGGAETQLLRDGDEIPQVPEFDGCTSPLSDV